MDATLYSDRLKQLAHMTMPLPSSPHRQSLHVNRLCGDSVRVGVRLNDDDIIDTIGYDVRACMICLASSYVACRLAEGKPLHRLIDLVEPIRLWLEDNVSFDAVDLWSAHEWRDAMEVFEPVRDYRARLLCVHLPWQCFLGLKTPSTTAATTPSTTAATTAA